MEIIIVGSVLCFLLDVVSATDTTSTLTASALGTLDVVSAVDTTSTLSASALPTPDARTCQSLVDDPAFKAFIIQCNHISYDRNINSSQGLSFSECIRECDTNSDCWAASYHRTTDPRRGNCNLKGASKSIGPFAQGDVAIKIDTRTCAQLKDQEERYGWVLQCDHASYDANINTTKGLTFSQCMDWCDATSGCWAASYHASSDVTRATCNLKGTNKQIGPNLSVDVGIKLDTRSCAELGNQTERAGFLLQCGFASYDTSMNSTGGLTFSQCIDWCGGTNGCMAAMYSRSSNPRNNRCHMKIGAKKFGLDANIDVAVKIQPTTTSTLSSTSSTTHATSSRGLYLSSSALPQTCQELADPGTFQGFKIQCEHASYARNLVNATHGLTFRECIDLCNVTEGCWAASLNRANPNATTGTCHLKDSQKSIDIKTNSDVAVKLDRRSCTQLRDGAEYDGYQIQCDHASYARNVINATNGLSLRECIDLCDVTKGCWAASLNRVNPNATTGSCHLKDSRKSISPHTSVDVAVRIDTRSCAQLGDQSKYDGFELKCKHASSDPNINATEGLTFGQCIDWCSVTDGCWAVSFVLGKAPQGVCNLKSGKSQIGPHLGIDVAVKLGTVSTTTESCACYVTSYI